MRRAEMSLSPTISVKELFLNACEEGNLELARVLLANGADVNWTTPPTDGNTLWKDVPFLWSGLHFAAHDGNVDLLDLLLAQPGVDVNITNQIGDTPLMLGSHSQNIVKRLLKVEGIDLQIRDSCEDSVLHWAAQRDHSGCVQELRAAAGLDWNLRNMAGETAIMKAATWGSADSLKILLTVSPSLLDITATDVFGENVAWHAVDHLGTGDHQRCVQLLSEDHRVDWNKRSQHGDTPLMYCLKHNELEIAKILINNPRVDISREILDFMLSGGHLKMSEYPVGT